jgi:oligopeptide/dipeptide ABC transporter ATP-binding protein
MTAASLLAVDELSVSLAGPDGPLPVLTDVSFTLARGGSLALVGESGCGKTMTALSLMGLLPPGARVCGSIRWEGEELLTLSEAERRRLRGRHLGMVFQEPQASLDPVQNAGEHVAEVLRYHRRLSRREAWREAVNLLEEVRLPDAEIRARSYAHQLSGGMRQRVMLAAALAADPALLIADEPTTALDVTVQARIVGLLGELRRRRGMALLFITHDLALVGELADELAVLYAGRLVEQGPAARVLARPAHPYTRALVRALPELWPEDGPSPELPGLPPAPGEPIAGCPFAPRCAYVRPICRRHFPQTLHPEPDRRVACQPEVIESAGEGQP